MLPRLKLSFGEDEMSEIFNTPMDSFDDILQYLKRELSRLGYGRYAHVFKYKNDRVVKLGYYRDKCWYQFGEYALKHNNKHYPKIYRLKAFFDNRYFLAEMEFMKPLEHLKDLDESIYPGVVELVKVMDRNYDGVLKSNDDLINMVGEKYPEDPVVKALKPFIKSTGCVFDLHKANFMWRKDNTLVINDPLAPK